MTARRIIVPGAMPSRDQNGRNLPAKLRFYEPDAAYDTLKAVYSDEALTTPFSQPILSDAAGRFPAIWADDAEEFDVTWSDQTFDKLIRAWANLSPLDDAVLASVALAESAADDADASAESAAASLAAVEVLANMAVAQAVDLGTKAQCVETEIPAAVKAIRLTGAAVAGDMGQGHVFVRTDAEPAHEGCFRSADRLLSDGSENDAAGGWWVITGNDWHVAIFGADLTGTTEATQAFTDAMTAMKAVNVGGGQIRWSGTPKVNLVVNVDGITLRGPGLVNNQQPPTGNYLQAWDDADPVIQFGDDASNTTGSFLRDSMVRGNNTGMYGVVFAPGAYKNGATNVQVVEFRNALTFRSSATLPCTYNIVSNIQIGASGDQCAGITFDGSAGTYCTANTVVGYYMQFGTGWGWTVRVSGSQANYLIGGWQQGGDIGGVLVEDNGSAGPTLFMDDSNVECGVKTLMVFKGDDLQDGSFDGIGCLRGTYNTNTNKSLLATKTATTGTISGGGLGTLTLASATGAWAGRAVLIFGAGSSGIPHFTTISAVSGTTVTLANAAATAVTGATVWIGDALADDLLSTEYTPPLSYRDAPAGRGVSPSLYRAGNTAALPPFNSFDPVFDLTANSLHFLAGVAGPTVSSIARVGTTVTVTTGSSHNVATGDQVLVSGANEAGFNGYYTATRTSSTTLTYTSAVSGSASATGTLSFRAFKRVTITSTGMEFPAGCGLRMRNASGTMNNVLYQSVSSSGLTLSTPDTSTGNVTVEVGSTVATGSSLSVRGSGGSDMFNVNTYGGMAIGGGQNPTRRGAINLYDTGADPGQAVSANGVFFYAKNNALFYKNVGDTVLRVQDTANGVTGSRPSSNLVVGQQYFDTTLGKPIWVKTVAGPVWVDAAGTTV